MSMFSKQKRYKIIIYCWLCTYSGPPQAPFVACSSGYSSERFLSVCAFWLFLQIKTLEWGFLQKSYYPSCQEMHGIESQWQRQMEWTLLRWQNKKNEKRNRKIRNKSAMQLTEWVMSSTARVRGVHPNSNMWLNTAWARTHTHTGTSCESFQH